VPDSVPPCLDRIDPATGRPGRASYGREPAGLQATGRKRRPASYSPRVAGGSRRPGSNLDRQPSRVRAGHTFRFGPCPTESRYASLPASVKLTSPVAGSKSMIPSDAISRSISSVTNVSGVGASPSQIIASRCFGVSLTASPPKREKPRCRNLGGIGAFIAERRIYRMVPGRSTIHSDPPASRFATSTVQGASGARRAPPASYHRTGRDAVAAPPKHPPNRSRVSGRSRIEPRAGRGASIALRTAPR